MIWILYICPDFFGVVVAFHYFIFATNKYQNKEKPLKRQRRLGLDLDMWPQRKTVTKGLNFFGKEISIIVSGLHIHNRTNRPD